MPAGMGSAELIAARKSSVGSSGSMEPNASITSFQNRRRFGVLAHGQPEVLLARCGMRQPVRHERRLPVAGSGAHQHQGAGRSLVQACPEARARQHREPAGLRRPGQGTGVARACSHPPGGRDALGMQSWRPGCSGCSPLLYLRSDSRQRISVKEMLAFPHRGMAPHPPRGPLTCSAVGRRPATPPDHGIPWRDAPSRWRTRRLWACAGGRGLEDVSMTVQTEDG